MDALTSLMQTLDLNSKIISEGDYPWYYQPMNIRIRGESDFQSLIKKHVRGI